MRRRDEQPVELSDTLNTLAGRLKKVDLRLVDEVRRIWPHVVDPIIAQHCEPQFIKNGVLVVRVPSGAFAQRITAQSRSIIEGCAVLGSGAPTSVRTVID